MENANPAFAPPPAPIAAAKPAGKKRGAKRSPLQRAEDLQLEESLALKGVLHVRIAEEVSKKRPYSICRQQVSVDLKKLQTRYETAAMASLSQQRGRALAQMALVESTAWAAFDRSQKVDAGNPAFLRLVIDAHDRKARMLGLEVAQRTEISGISGSPIQVEAANQSAVLSEAEKVDLLERHLQRLKSAAQEREKTEQPALAAAPTGES